MAHPQVCGPSVAPLWYFFAIIFFIYSKINLRKVLSNSENFLFLLKKQHHGSSAKSSVGPG